MILNHIDFVMAWQGPLQAAVALSSRLAKGNQRCRHRWREAGLRVAANGHDRKRASVGKLTTALLL